MANHKILLESFGD
uniref:Uncharacterized protein n=1 Tax=Rhizophora mucronata TaxID=61149 RepID=A0A2P2P908_RHIMU